MVEVNCEWWEVWKVLTRSGGEIGRGVRVESGKRGIRLELGRMGVRRCSESSSSNPRLDRSLGVAPRTATP